MQNGTTRHSDAKQATPCLPASPPDSSPGPISIFFFSQKPPMGFPKAFSGIPKSPTPKALSSSIWAHLAQAGSTHSPLSTAPSVPCTHCSSPSSVQALGTWCYDYL